MMKRPHIFAEWPARRELATRPGHYNSGDGQWVTHHSWLAQLLPYIEQQTMSDQLDFNNSAGGHAPFVGTTNTNRDIGGIDLSLARCPSDGDAERETPDLAPTNYVASIGNTGCTLPWGCAISTIEHSPGAPPDGVMYIASQVKMRQVTDGTSSTTAVSECLIGRPWVVRTGNPALAESILAGTEPDVDSNVGTGGRGQWWLFAARNQEWTFTTRIAPNDPLTSNQEPEVYSMLGYFAARSNHPGGVHVTFLDGSTHFIGDSVDILVWRAMGSQSGEEVVSR
ncbi:MAG: DUF1559 domain-containing protein [Planctomycetes bacterium]|nr:DUF1559 domain-containing protein [Planctomycetota bacterium]